MKVFILAACIEVIQFGSVASTGNPEKGVKPNVLFICVDDLRPDLGCYGNSIIKSPNIDKLAAEGVCFTNHFVNVPTCGASRASLLAGRLPMSKAYLENEIFATTISHQPEQEKPESFVHHLKRNGYYTVGIGKISHSPDGRVYGYSQPVSQIMELPYSWDEMKFDAGKWKTGWNAFFGYADTENRQSLKNQCKPYEKGKVDDMGYPDGLTAELAIKELHELASKKQPFFLGVGFFKPHLPFTAPEKYWDMYDEKDIQLTPAPNIPENINLASLHESAEFNQYKLGDENASLAKPVSDAYAKKLRHAYYACVSYVDAQIGKVLAELKRQGLDKNTIVVIWGDNGWHLGDDRVWGKHTLFEFALRTPLIIKAPGMKMNRSTNTSIVSSVDIYPTLMDLCGLKMPYQQIGNSLSLF